LGAFFIGREKIFIKKFGLYIDCIYFAYRLYFMADKKGKLIELTKSVIKVLSDESKKTPYRKFKPYAESILTEHAEKIKIKEKEKV
jgi:hypothetical protein